MTRHVFGTTLEVAHVFAQQVQDNARSSNSSFVNGTDFYSYRTMIAKLIVKKKQKILLLSDHVYSMTTNGQYSDILAAFRNHDVVIYRIPKVSACEYEHSENLRIYLSRFNEAVQKHSKAKGAKAAYARQANRIIEEMRKYAKFFDVKWKFPRRINITEADLLKEAAHEASVERSRITRSGINKAAQEKRQQENTLSQEEKLAEWRQHTLLGYFHPNVIALRISKDGKEIQTSQHASIPLADAIEAWPNIKAMHDKGRDFDLNGLQKKLGIYSVNEWRNDHLIVGCHKIPYSELELIAKQLGLYDPEPMEAAA